MPTVLKSPVRNVSLPLSRPSGPLPLYTALRRPPMTLAPSAPCLETARLWLIRYAPDAEPVLISHCPVTDGVVSLPIMEWEPGALHLWRLAPEDPTAEFDTEIWPCGVFRSSTSGEEATLSRAVRLLESADDSPHFAVLARAVLAAEVGLFRDALALLARGPATSERPGVRLLARVARANLYRDMQRRIREELPACGVPSDIVGRLLRRASDSEQEERRVAAATLETVGR